MAQNELMLRLIKDNKIAGYEWHRSYKAVKDSEIIIVHGKDIGTENLSGWNILVYPEYRIEYDSFEQGIKMPDGTWWFEGDLFKHKKYGFIGELGYGSSYGGFYFDWMSHNEDDENLCVGDYLDYHDAGYFDSLKTVLRYDKENLERISSIHEEMK